jgi:4'-phosphopantetheinyl transferase
MNSAEILIWFIEPETIQDPARLNRFLQWLSPEERAQHQRFRFDKHRHTYLVSHALMRGALSLSTRVEPAQFAFKTNAYGKPFVVAPAQEQSLNFNLSHTEGLAAVAISRHSELGIDVENKHRQDMTQTLAEHFFAPEECQAVAQSSEHERTIKMLEFWTLKESYIKAVGQGLSIALDSFAFRLATATQPASLMRLDAQDSDPCAWSFWQSQPTEHHIMALAFKSDPTKPILVKAQRAQWLAEA